MPTSTVALIQPIIDNVLPVLTSTSSAFTPIFTIGKYIIFFFIGLFMFAGILKLIRR